jgi:hypothetical protein
MDVSFGGTNDAQVLPLSEFNVRLHVAPWVDDNRLASLLATDKIRGMCERPVIKVFE